MGAGGEEQAVFRALKNDALDSLPKIAEKHASVVEEAAEKGTRNLAAHAATEAKIAEDLRAVAPKDLKAAGPRPAGGAHGPAGGAGTVPPPRTGPGHGPLEPEHYGNDALRDGPGYQQEIDRELAPRGLDRAEHDRLRLTPTNDLDEQQLRQVVQVRDAIKLDEGRMVTKIVKPDVAEAYLENSASLGGRTFNPGEFRGSIARGSDTADLRSMDDLRNGLALDDGGAGWTPVPPGATEAYQLRFPAPHGMQADPTLGAVGDQALADRVAGLAGKNAGRAWDEPFLGTGYTGGGVPEWDARPTGFPHGAEIWRMNADGTEEAVGHFDKDDGLWKYYDN
ncbi:hypothetical protein ACWEPB_20405 [Kitasatospora cineracea]